MNNITWGDNQETSYYETVAGGAGAVGDRTTLELSNDGGTYSLFARDPIGMDDPVSTRT
jgi:N-methylhydantoinase B/oxoprolinase/acetone carboxylase alpha subunit